MFSILVRMEPKKETGTQRALAIKAANQSNADILVLDLASSMSYERPYTLFEESLTKLDTLKCKDHDAWLGAHQSIPEVQMHQQNLNKMIAGIWGTLRLQ